MEKVSLPRVTSKVLCAIGTSNAQVPSISSAVTATRKWEHRRQSAGARREGRGVWALAGVSLVKHTREGLCRQVQVQKQKEGRVF